MEKAKQRLLKRFSAADGALFVVIIMDRQIPIALADGVDLHGRSVLLVGKAFISQDAAGERAVSWVLDQLRQGQCPDFVVPITLAPQASEACAEILEAGPVDDFLMHGSRWSGKTVVAFAALLALAEHHLRAHYDAPFLAMLLHDSLKSADAKSAQTLELPLWKGIWGIESDRTRAVCRLGGHDLIRMDFIGCLDGVSSERLRQSTHCVIAEEIIGSLQDGAGIGEDQYTLARSSMLRLETRRRVSVALTNPGANTMWPFPYWGLGGSSLPNRRAIAIPREDRLTAEQQAQLDASFATNPILQRRLSRGEWVGVVLGAAVATGFSETIHVAPQTLTPDPNYLLGIGFDGGHSPSAVVGQIIGGQIRVYASLNGLHTGMLQLIEQQLLPWLQSYAGWALQRYGAGLACVIDPNLSTPGQASIHESGENIIREKLGAQQLVHGPVRWGPRKEAVLRVLAPRHEGGRVPLQISPGPDTDLLVQALSGRWYYGTLPNGQLDSNPKKPNAPWADIGDAAAYVFGWLLSGDNMEAQLTTRDIKVETHFDVGGDRFDSGIYR